MNFKRPSRSNGFGLIEGLIVAMAISLAIVGVYRFYSSVEAREKAHQESQNVLQVTNNILKAYSALPDFTGMSNSQLVAEHLLPGGLDISGDVAAPVIGSGFGGTFSVAPTTLDGIPGSGLVLTYTDVPRRTCAQFITMTSAGYNFRDITVNSVNVMDSKRVMDQSLVINNCATQDIATVTFTLQRLQSGTPIPPSVCAVPSTSPETKVVACPTGYSGSTTQTRSASCPSGSPLPVWTPFVEVTNTCVQICAADPTSPQTRTSTPCPSGQYGTITEKRLSTCAVGQTTGLPTWSAWSVISDTCSPSCVVPADETRNTGCPTGFSGVFTERRSASCDLPVGNPTWGPWSTLTYSCAKTCVLPSPNPEQRWVANSGRCDAGYTGTKYWEVEQRRTASCPSSVGEVAYTGWSNTGSIRNEDTSQCATLCHAEENLERWVPKEGECPSGFSGSKSWEARETRTSFCAPNATTPTTSSWVPTGEQRNATDTCVAAACSVRGGTTFNWRQAGNQYDCNGSASSDILVQSGQSVSIDGAATINTGGFNFVATGTADYACNAGVLSATPSSATCVPTSCNISGATTTTWDSADNALQCSSTYRPDGQGTFSIPVGGTFVVSDITTPATGSLTMSCATSTQSLGLVAQATQTSTKSCNGSCISTPKPAAPTRVLAGCSTGQYGSWTQSDPYEASGFPTCWSNTTTEWLPAVAPSGYCTACPSPSTENDWVSAPSGTCAAGQYGSTDTQSERARTKSYVCPAGSATLPAPDYTPWSSTGQTRVLVNNCASCPSPSTETRWVPNGGASACASGSYGSSSSEKEQTRTTSYSCPAGTSVLPSPSTTAWTDTGNTRAGSSSCTVCPASSVETDDRWVPTGPGQSCLAGKYGRRTGYLQYEKRTRTKTYTCPAGSTELPAPSYTSWTTWARDFSTPWETPGCTDCPAPATTTTGSEWVPAPDQACATGEFGSTTWEQETTSFITTSYSCPINTYELPDPTIIQGFNLSGPTRQTGGSCSACPSSSSETRWDPRNPGCPTDGDPGVNSWDAQQTRNMSYVCPSGTLTLPSPSYSPWNDTGVKQNEVFTCNGGACTPWIEQRIEYASISCTPAYNVFECAPGSKHRTTPVTHTCPTGEVFGATGDWVIDTPADCRFSPSGDPTVCATNEI